MKTIRTQDEIDRQIEGLQKMKTTVPNFGLFGDNWAPIDAQINVLKGINKPDDFYEDETSDEYEDGNNDTYFAADKAEEWLRNLDLKEDLFEEE